MATTVPSGSDESRQPFLHGLIPAVAAPYQAWLGRDGQLRPKGAQGIYLGDTRLLSCAVLTVNGHEPECITAHFAPMLGGQQIEVRFLHRKPNSTGDYPLLALIRSLQVTPHGVRESIRIESAEDTPVRLEVRIRLASDLAPMASVRSGAAVEPQPAGVAARAEAAHVGWTAHDGGVSAVLVVADSGVAVSAGAADELARNAANDKAATNATDDSATPDPTGGDASGGSLDVVVVSADNGDAADVVFDVRLPARGTAELGWQLEGADPLAPVSAPQAWLVPEFEAGTATRDPTGAGVAAPVDGRRPRRARLARLAAQAASDVAGLRLRMPDGPTEGFLAAGAPWYFTLFGRDSLWAARLLLNADPTLAAGTLRTLAALQGTKTDPATAEEPGKIPHELRRGGFSLPGGNQGAALHLPPLYYGTVDATPLWVCLLHDAWQAGMPDAAVEPLLDSCEAALGWMVAYGDSDHDGFLEYIDPTGTGLANQGWKDSADAIRWPDGRLATGPIALCEVQGYAYEAAVGGAALLTAFGRPGSKWQSWAADLQQQFRDKFWCEDDDGRFPAIALDAEKQPVASVSSNIGHLLGTGLLNEDESAAAAHRLLQPDMFTGFGIRTLSARNRGYWPLSYHCGSVWSHDTAIFVAGLLKDGRDDDAQRVARALLDAAEAFDYRLPELFGGFARQDAPRPVHYPESCFPQAWAAASAAPILTALT